MKALAIVAAFFFTFASATAAPTITVWNGLTQSFGQIGNPQSAINILGNVSDPTGIQSLNYTLNGGSTIPLNMGADSRRLLKPGDFNADIPTISMNNGANTVVITATNTLNQISTATVTANYTAGQHWPDTYSIDWTTAGTIPSVAQIIDGHWTLFGGTVHPTFLGYDRLVGIGDKTWTDYEVTVPITITGIDSAGFNAPSNGPGVGLLFRWTGHTTNPIAGQPLAGYLPLGAIGWYNWDASGGGVRLKLLGNNLNTMQQDNSGFMMTFGVAYYFKMRVATIPGVGGEYKMKVWQVGQPEPGTWKLSGMQSLSDPQAGSLCLVAHHVNAYFGNVTVTGLSTDLTPPVISNIVSTPSPTTSNITWTTDEGSSSVVQYGLTTSYELGIVSNGATTTAHAIRLIGLTPSTTYHFKVQSADASANTATSSDGTFTTGPAGTLTCDHFNTGSLDTGLWTFINPLNDATLSMTGTQASISIPAYTTHDVWTGGNFGPRIIQSIPNANFDVQLKFDTPMNQRNQMAGLMIEQDKDNFIRCDFLYDGTNLRLFSASFLSGSPTTRIDLSIGGASVSPLYLKVNRTGNVWTASYSFNAMNWTVAGTYTYAITVRSVGPFFATSGTPSPAFTGLVNYFVNTGDAARASIKAFLQGSYVTPGDSMRTSLRSVIPLNQPYNAPPWNYAGTESVGSIPDSIVDWVLVELRAATTAASKVSTRAAFLTRSGRIVDTDGVSNVVFNGLAPGDYYAVVRHRNHVPVLSSSVLSLAPSPVQYSFTGSQASAYGSSPMVQVAAGVFALPAGDADASGSITSADWSSVLGSLNITTYHLRDINLSGIVTFADANIVLGNLGKTSQVP